MARPRLYDWDEIHRLHAQGMSPYSISKKLGCRLYTVQYALNPAPPEHRRAVLKRSSACRQRTVGVRWARLWRSWMWPMVSRGLQLAS